MNADEFLPPPCAQPPELFDDLASIRLYARQWLRNLYDMTRKQQAKNEKKFPEPKGWERLYEGAHDFVGRGY